MTRLDDHYRYHPFLFFIGHMVAIVATLAVFISGILLAAFTQGHAPVLSIHALAGYILLAFFVIGALEAIIVKLGASGKGDPPFCFRYKALKDAGKTKLAAVYAVYCVLSWAVIPVIFICVTLSGIGMGVHGMDGEAPVVEDGVLSYLALANIHKISAVLFLVTIVAHLILSVPARRAREEGEILASTSARLDSSTKRQD